MYIYIYIDTHIMCIFAYLFRALRLSTLSLLQPFEVLKPDDDDIWTALASADFFALRFLVYSMASDAKAALFLIFEKIRY